MSFLQNILKKYKSYFSSKSFKRKLRQEKIKLYSQIESKNKYTSKRNKYKLFKTKLEFENTFPDIKKINFYYFLIGSFLILSTVYVIAFSHYFTIKSIDIIKEDELINIDLAYKSIEKYRYKSFFTLDKSLVSEALVSHQPNIKIVDIKKIIPDNLKITLKSYDSFFDTKINQKNYTITQNWVFIPSKESKNTKQIEIIWLNNSLFLDYKQVLDKNYINNIKQIENLILENTSLIEIEKEVYFLKEQELHLTTKDGIVIIFDLTKEPKVQFDKLNIFLKKHLSVIKSWIVYIDLRINQKIIYCPKSDEFQCKLNLKSIYE